MTKETDELGIRIANVLIESNSGKPPMEAVNAIRAAFVNRDWNMNALLIVLPSFDKVGNSDIVSLLFL